MKVEVIKRDGSIEEFEKEKIAKVVKAAGLTEEKAEALSNKVAEEIRNLEKERVSSKEIRDLVTSELKKADEYAYGLYVWYEKMKDNDGKNVKAPCI
jgi:transcriptional regulator NrdR family protein